MNQRITPHLRSYRYRLPSREKRSTSQPLAKTPPIPTAAASQSSARRRVHIASKSLMASNPMRRRLNCFIGWRRGNIRFPTMLGWRGRLYRTTCPCRPKCTTSSALGRLMRRVRSRRRRTAQPPRPQRNYKITESQQVREFSVIIGTCLPIYPMGTMF